MRELRSGRDMGNTRDIRNARDIRSTREVRDIRGGRDIGNMKEKLGNDPKNITPYMLELGVPAHLKGYNYLRASLYLAAENLEKVCSVTKLLYPEVAKLFNTTDQKVERAIRNAIEVSWKRGNPQLFEDLFGYAYPDGQGRPTNSEYIAAVADRIRLERKETVERY